MSWNWLEILLIMYPMYFCLLLLTLGCPCAVLALHSCVWDTIFLHSSLVCLSILQCVHLIGFHSYATFCLMMTTFSFVNLMNSGKCPSKGISISNLAYFSIDISFVYLSVFSGMPRMLPVLLRLRIPQYLISNSRSSIHIGSEVMVSMLISMSGFHAFTMKGFWSKWKTPFWATTIAFLSWLNLTR